MDEDAVKSVKSEDTVKSSATADAYPVTVDHMWSFFNGGAVGTKEFRSWLALIDPVFRSVRDADIDNEIDAEARRRREALRVDEAQPPVDREGLIRGE